MTVIHEYRPVKVGNVYEDKSSNRFEVMEYYSPFIKFKSLQDGQFSLLSDELVNRVYKEV